MEQQSYDRIYVILITRIGCIGPRVVCYWNTSEVRDRKLKIHYEREGKSVKQCNLTNQVKKTNQKEDKTLVAGGKDFELNLENCELVGGQIMR